MADLSEEKGFEPLSQWAFIGFSLHRNTGSVHKAHQSLAGRNDQGMHNTQRTTGAYLSPCQID